VRDAIPWQRYEQALIRELYYWAEHPAYRQRTLTTLFFGGGTPSLAPPSLIAHVLQTARTLFPCSSDAEVTLEANPGSSDAVHFAELHACGINRLSIGVQSLQSQQLQWLERIHTKQEALTALAEARASGFDNINLDLMYGLPGQNCDNWLQTLQQAIALTPEHLSCYQLTVEPHTQLAYRHQRTPYALPEEQLALTLMEATRNTLASHGYEAYEISNFAKPGRYCRHNDAYWCYHDYIGIGAGAAGKFDHADGSVTRYGNTRTPEHYMHQIDEQGHALQQSESLSVRMAAAEAIWLGLRRSDGIHLATFRQRFGNAPDEMFADALAPFMAQNALQTDTAYMKVTTTGRALADEIAACVIQAAIP